MASMNGRICLVTGAAGTIGKPMCIELARQGATVVMAGRGAAKMKAAAEEVKAASGNPNVESLEVDLGSLASVRRAAEEYQRRFPALHLLVNNAAVYSGTRRTTADGFESMIGTSHLGHFLLTNLLVPTLKKSAPSRVVVMTMETKGGIDLDDLQTERKKYDAFGAFNQSKAATTCFALELAKRLAGSGVTVNAIHPGLTQSTLPREAPLPLRLVFAVFGARPEKAKDGPLRLATSPELANVTGRFYVKAKEKAVPRPLADEAMRARLWKESARLVGIAA